MKFKFVSLLIVFLSFLSNAQDIKIIKVIDANLFETDDGRTIKLAGIDVPSRKDKNEKVSKFVELTVIPYLEDYVKNKKTRIFTLSENAEFDLVYLYRSFEKSEKNLNEEFVLKGFGKFYNNIATNDSSQFLKNEKFARDNKIGIWSINQIFENKIVDLQLNSFVDYWSDKKLTFNIGMGMITQIFHKKNQFYLSISYENYLKYMELIFNTTRLTMGFGLMPVSNETKVIFDLSGSLLYKMELGSFNNTDFFLSVGPLFGMNSLIPDEYFKPIVSTPLIGIDTYFGFRKNNIELYINYRYCKDIKKKHSADKAWQSIQVLFSVPFQN